jgi:hypothetical protein
MLLPPAGPAQYVSLFEPYITASMAQELALPDFARDDARYELAVRALRDHLLGAVDVDREIGLNGRAYVVAWADRRATDTDAVACSLASGMRVLDEGGARPEIVGTGEEQITIVVDGERLVFHLVETDGPGRRRPSRTALR